MHMVNDTSFRSNSIYTFIFRPVQEIGIAEPRTTVIVIMAPVTSARKSERNVDAIMFAAKDSNVSSAVAERS